MSVPQPVAYIYLIRNKVNGWVYVGATKIDIQKRFKQHMSTWERWQPEWYKPRNVFKRDVKKYGADAFTIELIENIYDENLVGEVEGYWIDKYYGDSCYNATKKSTYYYDTSNRKKART